MLTDSLAYNNILFFSISYFLLPASPLLAILSPRYYSEPFSFHVENQSYLPASYFCNCFSFSRSSSPHSPLPALLVVSFPLISRFTKIIPFFKGYFLIVFAHCAEKFSILFIYLFYFLLIDKVL